MAVNGKSRQDWMDKSCASPTPKCPVQPSRAERAARATGQGGILMEPISNESP
ncbi:hypothetical protein FOVG_05699 [Fusarium oxysporum f. sp. pisi HDV247]|uniref:Uncharacterized protein n=1 Tax=Fusarium oxysporum f. sp. pisi HDV247 TaxID=1080344 RepID=W9PPI7_FUSOX|nr:hypothetical protein FOVG_05699 [Fusarium oxysporum f. sp. pisi HDV247]